MKFFFRVIKPLFVGKKKKPVQNGYILAFIVFNFIQFASIDMFIKL